MVWRQGFINIFSFLFLDERNNRVVQKEKDANEPLFEGFIAFMRQVWQSNIILQKWRQYFLH